MKIIAQNKKASHDYFILEKYEAGIKLKGTEIKSIRLGKTSVNDAYIQIKNNVPIIINMHISKYDKGNIFNHDETRTRELLLNKKEILKVLVKLKTDGITMIPLKVYLKDSLCKIEIALAKGKQNYDKREDLKEKDSKRRMDKVMKELRH